MIKQDEILTKEEQEQILKEHEIRYDWLSEEEKLEWRKMLDEARKVEKLIKEVL